MFISGSKIFCLCFLFLLIRKVNAQNTKPLSFNYSNTGSWEKRKDSLRKCILETLQLNAIPRAEGSVPIITPGRRYNGYTVENIALESTPGLYVCGSIYRPLITSGKIPVVLVPNGHFTGGRYRADVQYICASLARMGAMAISYDLFGWGESKLQVREEDHNTSTALIVQTLNTRRLLDYVCSLKQTDTSRVAITGASGGGSQSMLNTALDDRIKVSAPVVMLSSVFPGGCACESGLPIHACAGGTNNAEIAAMAAPRPQLIISDGNDWTRNVPEIEFPYLQKVYKIYGKPGLVRNIHLKNEWHDYGVSKRSAMYAFMASALRLNIGAITKNKIIDESGATIEDETLLYVFGKKGERLPANALKGIRDVQMAVNNSWGQPLYEPAPLGSVKPEGWLLQQLKIMAKGSSGHLDEIYDRISNDNGWLGGKGDGWEETPYWLDGSTPLAYLLDDEQLKKKVLRYINWTLDHQRPSGYFGPVTESERKGGAGISVDNCAEGEDWWPKMVMLKVLQQYYSATHDQRVITFMSKYFHYQLQAVQKCHLEKWTDWSQARGQENIMMVNWLHTITKEKYLTDLADTLSRQSFQWSKWFGERDLVMQAASQQNDDNNMRRHAVNVAMALKDPAVNYQRSHDKKYLAVQKTALHDLMLLHGMPQGVFSGDESLHGNDLCQGTELCTVVETMYSLEKILEATGDIEYMDALERIAFNALPAQTSDDYNFKQYYQLPNQVQIARGALSFTVTQPNGTYNVLGTKSGYTCCYANMHQGWTKFTAQLWHYRGDDGIACLSYAPSEFHARIKGQEMNIREVTGYPFDDKITFKISAGNDVDFAWQFRIPSWCKKASIFLNGQILRTDEGGQIIAISRTWQNNDEVIIQLPMDVTTSNWAKNSRTVERGPLVYALKIGEEWKKDNDSQAGVFYSVYPTTPWNYGLVQSIIKDPSGLKVSMHSLPEDFVWNQAHAPIEITATVRKLPSWKLDDGILHQPVSDGSGCYRGLVEDSTEQVKLIPYGCTKLRIVAFPVVK